MQGRAPGRGQAASRRVERVGPRDADPQVGGGALGARHRAEPADAGAVRLHRRRRRREPQDGDERDGQAVTRRPLGLFPNPRIPPQRAQALQVAETAAAFVRAGASTTVLHARRKPVIQLPPGTDALDWYGVEKGKRPMLVSVPCIDWIDRVPRILQYVPARLQEQSFARNAARIVRDKLSEARVLSREIETALVLVRAGHARTFLEIHRVPGGRLRRRWLVEAASRALGIVAISNGVLQDLVELGIQPSEIRVEHDGFSPARFGKATSKVD